MKQKFFSLFQSAIYVSLFLGGLCRWQEGRGHFRPRASAQGLPEDPDQVSLVTYSTVHVFVM
jgi:hypothetical protein